MVLQRGSRHSFLLKALALRKIQTHWDYPICERLGEAELLVAQGKGLSASLSQHSTGEKLELETAKRG